MGPPTPLVARMASVLNGDRHPETWIHTVARRLAVSRWRLSVIALTFRLMAKPPLGNFRFRTGSWGRSSAFPSWSNSWRRFSAPRTLPHRNPRQLLLPQRCPKRGRHTVAYPVHVLPPGRQPSQNRHAPSS